MDGFSNGNETMSKLLQFHVSRDWLGQLTSNASYCDASRGAKCLFYDITAPKMQSLNLSMKKHKRKLWNSQQNNYTLKGSKL